MSTTPRDSEASPPKHISSQSRAFTFRNLQSASDVNLAAATSSEKSLVTLGVLARTKKVRSKPMTEILNRIRDLGGVKVVVMDNETMELPVKSWPKCDVLITFFSSGFPMELAQAYVKRVQPKLVNDLDMQTVLWDRRTISVLMAKHGINIAQRAIVNRDSWTYQKAYFCDEMPSSRVGATVFKVKSALKKEPQPSPDVFLSIVNKEDSSKVVQRNDAIYFPNGERLYKPFVEKPADSEDHGVIIYYHSKQGGGARRMFRKIGDKSSEFDPDCNDIRTEGSYVYEAYIEADGLQDIKAYSLGPHYCHAEMRKSPAVDGMVDRTSEGKERRYRTVMTREEYEFTKAVVGAFKQYVCGFDIIRSSKLGSFVCDVNGWSFVKGDAAYYDAAASRLRTHALELKRGVQSSENIAVEKDSLILRGVFAVFRHADRTPKQKMSTKTKNAEVCSLLMKDGNPLKNRVLRSPEDLLDFLARTIPWASTRKTEEEADAYEICALLMKCYAGTKLQLKSKQIKGNHVKEAKIIVKWGGAMTHSGKHQSEALGSYLRKFLFDANEFPEEILEDVKVKVTDESRVLQTARYVTALILGVHNLQEGVISMDQDILDNTRDAEKLMEECKAHLAKAFNSNEPIHHQTARYGEKMVFENPRDNMDKLRDLITDLVADIEKNIEGKAGVVRELCGEEDFVFMLRRWKKLLREFVLEDGSYNVSKIPDVFDYVQFDALHNQELGINLEPLFYQAARLARVAVPMEYGRTVEEKEQFGRTVAGPLMREIMKEMGDVVKMSRDPQYDGPVGKTRLYFTSENHIYALLHTLLSTKFMNDAKPSMLNVNYLSHVVMSLFETTHEGQPTGEFHVQFSYSEGANGNPFGRLSHWHTLYTTPMAPMTHKAISLDDLIGFVEHM